MQPSELHRLTAASSVVDRLAHDVDDFELVPHDELSHWLNNLSLPPGWRTGHLGDSSAQPSRIAVYGEPRPQGGWDACDTIDVYRFTGGTPDIVVHQHADCTLKDLAADSITTYPLTAPPMDGVAAMRSSGYFGVAGRRIWAQYSTYVRSACSLFDGLLIYHVLFVEARRRASLRDDIADLSDSVHHAFLTDIGMVDDACHDATSDSEVEHDGT
jgi:hypothetical protein